MKNFRSILTLIPCVAACIAMVILWFTIDGKKLQIHYLKNAYHELTSEKDKVEAKYKKTFGYYGIILNENIKLKKKIKELCSPNINETESNITKYILTNYKKVPPIIAKEISKVILEKSLEHNVPYPVILAVIEVESDFDPYSVSKLKFDPARGLMQVRYNVWKETLGLKSAYDLHSISGGIDAGTRVLRKYLDDTKNNLGKTLYKYVGKNRAYINLVYNKMGKFTAFEAVKEEK